MTCLIRGMFTQYSQLQRNSWWDSTCITFLAGLVTSWLLNSQSPQHHFKKETFFSGTCCGKQMQDCSAWDCAKATCQDCAKQSQRALMLWTHGTHPSSAPQPPSAWCGIWRHLHQYNVMETDGFSCLPRAGRGAKKNQILVLLKAYFTYCCWASATMLSPTASVGDPKTLLLCSPHLFFSRASWVSPLPEAAVYPCRSGTDSKKDMT